MSRLEARELGNSVEVRFIVADIPQGVPVGRIGTAEAKAKEAFVMELLQLGERECWAFGRDFRDKPLATVGVDVGVQDFNFRADSDAGRLGTGSAKVLQVAAQKPTREEFRSSPEAHRVPVTLNCRVLATIAHDDVS